MSVLHLLGDPAAELLYCAPTDELLDVARDLVNHNVNAIVVLNGTEDLVGILTDFDIMRALAHSKGDLSGIEVYEWMTEKVITCAIDEKLADALRLMGRYGIRHLVVTDCGVPVATLSIRDVLAKIHEHDELEISVLRDIAVAARASVAA
ncbi:MULTISPECIES: cyclic nucleotide-binding/CBS domain-containing protein [Hyphomonas]|jgi:predicted transcriptional regulator|uniref:CBS domain-containing protein n=1 Tax=Hyphomonas TaxID=85 RepID=UPI000C8DCADA|nr:MULTISPECIES: CBS domain-containing protein [unclassified Hyphomonas]MAL46479.1 hypothetical protein [Hyphomonas sp.]HAW57321.1 hypothetical protein [Hyphomonas sp.]HBJ42442.1 hypothetical protein [Hyphomonas sp.]HBN93095.1 hypothetical protein [Hyphomonas sp.]HBT36720.1 hypothetical protein [Hyphomonas sp.]|tara:strand:+ start:9898 stop:10347 length:450 start_codon:yes stop_codon:yes gene_type:complete